MDVADRFHPALRRTRGADRTAAPRARARGAAVHTGPDVVRAAR
ncbi:hypothetical protein [Streptomyces sp. Tu 3180]|nr:hypothetical protein [Streptomyces sp. Tu 3180]